MVINILNGQAIKIKTYGDFSPIPTGLYGVQIADVNIKSRFNRFKGVEEDCLNYHFTILSNGVCEDGTEIRGRFLWHVMSPSLNTKSWLFKLATAVAGRALTKEEMETFDPESLIGKQVNVMLEQAPNKDNTAVFNNIISYSKTLKPLKADFKWSDEDRKQAKESTSAIEQAPVTVVKGQPDPLDINPSMDLDDPFGTGPPKVDMADLDDDEETEEELEAKLAKAKAAKKAKAKNKEAPFPLN